MEELHCDSSRRATALTVARRPQRCCARREGPLIDLPVHELVDDLCKKAVILCAGGEILGIVAVSRS